MSYSSSGGGNNLQFNVTATNETNLKEAATIVETKLKDMDDLSKVKTNLEDSKKEWQIHVDQTKYRTTRINTRISSSTSNIPYEEITYW